MQLRVWEREVLRELSRNKTQTYTHPALWALAESLVKRRLAERVPHLGATFKITLAGEDALAGVSRKRAPRSDNSQHYVLAQYGSLLWRRVPERQLTRVRALEQAGLVMCTTGFTGELLARCTDAGRLLLKPKNAA